MNEYLQKKNLEGQKTTQDRMKELQDAERRAKEIRESLKVEKKKEFEEKIHNFHLFGMSFRPWTLNDMVIFLLIGIIVIGALSFVPGKDVSSDIPDNEGSFFTKLFGGFTVKSVEDENSNAEESTDVSEISDTTETAPETTDSSEDTSTVEEIESIMNPVNFDIDLKYKDSAFTTLNSTGADMIWYTLSIRNLETFYIKCNIDHYVNDKLKDDRSTFTVEGDKSFDVNLREIKADSVDTLSKIRIVIMCWDGVNENTKNEKLQRLKFYFS